MSSQGETVEICRVVSNADLMKFIKFPWEIYRDNEHWVPPLIKEQKRFLTSSNPFFEHAEAEYYLAKRDGKICGRISISIDKNYIDFQHDYFTKHEKLLHKYYETDDRRWLYKYWAEGEDSYWNRRYYPIEYYGDRPLYDDSKRKELGPPSERLGHFKESEFQSFILKDDEYENKWKEVIEGSG